jgi:phage tail-like protein
MPGLIKTDPIVARNFYLEIPAYKTTVILQSVNSITVEMQVTASTQVGQRGFADHAKTVGVSAGLTPEVEMTRLAPQKAASDKIWEWLNRIRSSGFESRTSDRQNMMLMLYDSLNKNVVGQFTLWSGWPFKIVTDPLDASSSEAMKEVITFCCERVTRDV